QTHLGHIGFDWRQFDALVNLLRSLRGIGECRRTVWTGRQPGIDHAVGVGMQGPTNPRAALAWTDLTLRAVLLLALRWGSGGVVRSLRWPGQFIEARFKRGDACVLRRDPLVRR